MSPALSFVGAVLSWMARAWCAAFILTVGVWAGREAHRRWSARQDVKAARSLARKLFAADPAVARAMFLAAVDCADPNCVGCAAVADSTAFALAEGSWALPEARRTA